MGVQIVPFVSKEVYKPHLLKRTDESVLSRDKVESKHTWSFLMCVRW